MELTNHVYGPEAVAPLRQPASGHSASAAGLPDPILRVADGADQSCIWPGGPVSPIHYHLTAA